MKKLLQSLLALCLFGLTALLPLRVAQAIGTHVGRRLYRRNAREARTTRTNLRHCFPELSESERETLVQRSLEETGKTILEMGGCWLAPSWVIQRRIRSVRYQELMQQAMASGKGVILIAPHLGNWEVMNAYLSQHYDMTAMYKPTKWPLLDRMILKRRERTGTKMAPASRKGVMMVLRQLRKSGLVAVLSDQQPEPSGGLFEPFFGIQALTMTLVPKLAVDTDAAVICGYARRLPKGQGFEICFREADPLISDKPLASSVAAMNRSVEGCVREAPEQYQWEYRRFGERPSEDPTPISYR